MVGQKEKILLQMRNNPRNVTFDDMVTLVRSLGFTVSNKGKTSGSRIMLVSEEHGSVLLHKPHPQKELKEYQVKQILKYLEEEGLI